MWDTTPDPSLTKRAAYMQLTEWASGRQNLVLGMDGNNTRDWLLPSEDTPRRRKARRTEPRRWLESR